MGEKSLCPGVGPRVLKTEREYLQITYLTKELYLDV